MTRGRPIGSKNRPKRNIWKEIEEARQVLILIQEAAEATNKKLIPLGFPGLSARMILAEVNEELAKLELPALSLSELKHNLTTLGYRPNERAYSPSLQAMYTAWSKESV